MANNPDAYKFLTKKELRELCAFQDRTIEILKDALYRKDKPEPTPTSSKYVVVKFQPTGPGYTYLSGGLDLHPGDKVIVPVGRDNNESGATVMCRADSPPTTDLPYKTVHRKDSINV